MVIDWSEAETNGPRGDDPRIPAAEYVRMSTEHQRYSTDNQRTAIRSYAERRGYEIVRTYADEGKSGLNLGGRFALQELLQDVEAGHAQFRAVLVYDVSRWGRFQDPDEAATYELRCRRAGVDVHYCAEQFENDGSIGSSIIKTVKRAMAGEYSRELSVKVFAGQAHLIRLGYRQGGAAGFGLRRLLVDQAGNPKGELAAGEHKSIATDRVVLVHGPPEEVRTVREIYAMFIDDSRSEREIAAILNGRGTQTDLGRSWTRGTVHQILINEKYVGNNVWGRTSFKLKQRHRQNPRADWIMAEGAFPAIVERSQFEKAAAIIAARSTRLSDDQMLELLRSILEAQGELSGLIIDEQDDCPSSSAYRSRFGGLLRAYALVGFTPPRDYRYLEINRALRRLHPSIMESAVRGIRNHGGVVAADPETDLLTINQEFTATIIVARCFQTVGGSPRWKVRLDTALKPDVTVVVRMSAGNETPLDYYLLPRLDMREAVFRLCEYNGLSLDAYRFDTLDRFFRLAQRTPFRRAA